MQDLLSNIVAVIAYGVVALLVMVLSYVIVDLLTPGKLKELIWVQRAPGAAALLGTDLLASAIVIFSAIMSSGADTLWLGLLGTVIYSVIGIVLMTLSFLVIDALTPGKLGQVIAAERFHPAVVVNMAAHLGIAIVMAAAIY
ncbi:DUF350 domain-containing protein [Granulicoccus phenolivorans]|uniref:DUF350 domain-containing protein n=1 Tax=Granulicoccus phenolivorans TaxID=266854 RepID=UPI00042518F4|nr:DUF350 domain-containing protein [Granulicoccus phenolivorans]